MLPSASEEMGKRIMGKALPCFLTFIACAVCSFLRLTSRKTKTRFGKPTSCCRVWSIARTSRRTCCRRLIECSSCRA